MGRPRIHDPVKRNCEFCGKEFSTKRTEVLRGGGRFCCLRCFHLNMRVKITGKRFGRLVVEKQLEPEKYKKRKCVVVCDCGARKTILENGLVSGMVKSCGCRLREAAREKCGEKHWNWKGGLSRQLRKGGFTETLKAKIRKRDDYLCQHPFCYKPEITQAHSVHHIDFNKNNHEETNLISLCRSHHCATQWSNREYWIEFYFEIQRMRGIL